MTDYQKLAEYENLEKAGNLVRLAVPVDGYLYRISNHHPDQNWCVERYKITEIKISRGCICYVGHTDDWWEEHFWEEQLKQPKSNKFVFTSREEAESELKRRQCA